VSKKNKKIKYGFSLVELSIVLLIIGIIIAGVTQSTRLIAAFRLSTARSLTQSSPVPSISNLSVWFDTTSQDSFNDNEADNNSSVSTWKEINPVSANKQILQAVTLNQPQYISDCINGLPCLRFDGVDDSFGFDGSALVGNNYTIFVVEQRRSDKNDNSFIGGSSTIVNSNLRMGYADETTLRWGQYSNDYYNNSSIPSYGSSPPFARIHSYRLDSNSGLNYFVNGELLSMIIDSSNTGFQTDYLTSFVGASIGSDPSSNSFYAGDIAEIIIFNRSLKESERREIDSYLAKKWKINLFQGVNPSSPIITPTLPVIPVVPPLVVS